MKPNFIVIGAPKSGTTSLYYYLKQHPDVYLPTQKELHYFSFEKLSENANGPGDEQVLASLCPTSEEYAKHYANVAGEKAVGDISPSYLYYGVHDRIKRELGDVKIIVMLRNPVDKAYSQYMHLVRDQRETFTFYDALLAEEERRRKGWSDIWKYAESSLYTDRLRGYMDCFGRDRVHAILFDDFVNDSQSVVKGTLDFLKLDSCTEIDTNESYNRTGASRSTAIANFLNRPSFIKSFIKRMTPDAWRIALRLKIMDANTAGKEPIDDKSADYLREYFSEDIAQLELLLNRPLNWRG